MNDIEHPQNQHPQDDWQSLADDWREQPVSRVDVDALLRGIRQRGRRLRWAVGSELAGTLAMLAIAAWASRSPAWNGSFAVLMGVLIAAALVFQGGMLWARRNQMRDIDQNLASMVELDIARGQTTLRYWRTSIWLSLAMLLVLYAVAGSASEKVLPGVFVGAFPGLGFAVWAWWRCRGIRLRLARMRRIRDELRME
ncbi:MAG: hypothetical protein A2579_03240 [Lysobacterales bacterium RIFOXYD1_FULL_69_11]|nr:MAG: hypothetical protein A2190_01120 [Xanthomonadales bacterium RIFOXYA1_FULL_69_10]OHE86610.1 MAG: hypothetical protein A2579_03240 [Xanthomonadales bacterium RIFOXYD1_FULL_69_11]